jgi:purine-binding chemotaxis protein CheW
MLQTHSGVTADDVAADGVATERMVLFLAGGHTFGIAVSRIREIIPAREYTPLPGTGAHVCGLINLRGRIVTVVDLAARLGLAPASAHPGHSIVIAEHGDRLLGMAVEDVVRIVTVDLETLDASAEVLRSLRVDRAYLRGVGEVDDEIFVAVDPDQIFGPILG